MHIHYTPQNKDIQLYQQQSYSFTARAVNYSVLIEYRMGHGINKFLFILLYWYHNIVCKWEIYGARMVEKEKLMGYHIQFNLLLQLYGNAAIFHNADTNIVDHMCSRGSWFNFI